MRIRAGWAKFEEYIQERLGLDATISSGNQFYDPGDAVDNDGHTPWPLYVECKYTAAASKPVKRDETDAWRRRAEMLGKRFVLALRFFDERNPRLSTDYVLITLEDYEEMLTIVRKHS